MDSEENMAKLVLLYVMLSIYVADIVYLWRLQKSLKFAILECKKSKICDFLIFKSLNHLLYLLQRYFGRVTVEHSHGISSKVHTHQKINAVTSTFHYDCCFNFENADWADMFLFIRYNELLR